MSRLSDALCWMRYWLLAILNPPINPSNKQTMTSDALPRRNAYLLMNYLSLKRNRKENMVPKTSAQKYLSVAEPTCKPNSVLDHGPRPGTSGDHSSGGRITAPLLRPTRKRAF